MVVPSTCMWLVDMRNLGTTDIESKFCVVGMGRARAGKIPMTTSICTSDSATLLALITITYIYRHPARYMSNACFDGFEGAKGFYGVYYVVFETLAAQACGTDVMGCAHGIMQGPEPQVP